MEDESFHGYSLIRYDDTFLTSSFVIDEELAQHIRDPQALQDFLSKEITAYRIQVLPHSPAQTYTVEISQHNYAGLQRAAERLDAVLVQMRDAAYFLTHYAKILTWED